MTIELFVFDASPQVVDAVAGPDAACRADAMVVDWERSDKHSRQRRAHDLLGFDTQIAPDSPVDLETVVVRSSIPVVCRIDAWSGSGAVDLERAIDAGVAEVLLPMVRTVAEVEQALHVADGQVGVGVMIETIDAVAAAASLAALPISRAYVGLVDLAIERGTPDIFTPLADGTLERVAEACSRVPLGFAGLTVPGHGSPVPTTELADAMLRFGAAFTFLRRSFLADAGSDLAAGLAAIRDMLAARRASIAASVEPVR